MTRCKLVLLLTEMKCSWVLVGGWLVGWGFLFVLFDCLGFVLILSLKMVFHLRPGTARQSLELSTSHTHLDTEYSASQHLS